MNKNENVIRLQKAGIKVFIGHDPSNVNGMMPLYILVLYQWKTQK